MASYTLITTRPSGGKSTYVFDYADDAGIIADAKQALGEHVIAISIARGGLTSELLGLGAWGLVEGEPRWMTPGLAALAPSAAKRARRHRVEERGR